MDCKGNYSTSIPKTKTSILSYKIRHYGVFGIIDTVIVAEYQRVDIKKAGINRLKFE